MWLYLCLQLVPARCERGAKVQDPPRRLRSPRVFLRSRQLPQRLHLGLVLLHRRRAAPVQPHGGAAVHGGRQQELRRFLESSAVAGQELQHLLPGHEQSQRGECCRYMKATISLTLKQMEEFSIPSKPGRVFIYRALSKSRLLQTMQQLHNKLILFNSLKQIKQIKPAAGLDQQELFKNSSYGGFKTGNRKTWKQNLN